jgi:DUF971 family protein
MGFWNDLKNAAPHKGVARGHELYAARVNSIEHGAGLNPSDLKGAEIKCEVCHMRFGAAFSKSSYPCIVQVSMFDHLSFGEHLPTVVACNKCVETFDLDTARQRTKAENAEAERSEAERERKAAERSAPRLRSEARRKEAKRRDAEAERSEAERERKAAERKAEKASRRNFQPTEIRVKRKEKTLEISFDDGNTFTIPAELLRVESPSSDVQGHASSQKTIVAGRRHVGIIAAEPVGNYAVRLKFDDLHDTGIFTWEALYKFGADQDAMWQRYLDALAEKGLSREPSYALTDKSDKK